MQMRRGRLDPSDRRLRGRRARAPQHRAHDLGGGTAPPSARAHSGSKELGLHGVAARAAVSLWSSTGFGHGALPALSRGHPSLLPGDLAKSPLSSRRTLNTHLVPMKKFMLLTAALAFLPACQQGFQNEIIEDQDRQIAGYKAKANRSQSELDLAKARRLELEEQLAFEQDRVNSLEGRLQAMEASAQQADAEVDRLRGQLAGTGVGVERRGDVLVLNLPTNLTFSSGSATLNAKGKSSLKTVAAALKADYDGKTFWVEGHTDN